ncbi:MAG: YlbF family regulator [Thermoanaerobacteraceae bacterium]|nr:YlbF family regulator [Thermoanaerobacteraceae bacterium]
MSFETKAQEFAVALKKTKEYQDLEAAQARIKLDPFAQELIADLEQTQQKIYQAQVQGQPVDKEIQQFQLLQQKAMNNAALKQLFAAQENFGKIMEQANNIITRELFG